MSYVETREQNLKNSIIPQNAKEDLADFWKEQVDFLRTFPLQVSRKKLDLPYEKSFITYEVTYNTHDKTMINAWFSVPAGQEGKKLPCVAYYHGGGGSKSLEPFILATGVCCFSMDVRSQSGTSIDRAEYTFTDNMGSLMSRDITNKNSFYMRNIYLDAVRAMDVIATLPEVDPERIVTFGQSQGGALSMVAGAFSGRAKKCYVCEPSYNCLHRRIEQGSGIFGPATTMLRIYPHLTDQVFETLTYFDVNNIASLLTVETDVALALADPICIPQFVYSVYTHIAGPKQLHMYPFVTHTTPDPYMKFFHRELSEL